MLTNKNDNIAQKNTKLLTKIKWNVKIMNNLKKY